MRSLTLTGLLLVCIFSLSAQTWTELNPPDNLFNNTIFAAVADKNGRVYAAGRSADSSNHYPVVTLTNGIWTQLGAPGNTLQATNTIYALALDSSGNLYAGGAFTDATGNHYVAKWNGSQWSALGSGAAALNPAGQIFSLATDAAGNVYAGGEFSDAAGNYYISKWNGQTWTQLGTGTHALKANGIIYSILPDPAGNIYLAGVFKNAAGKYYVARWNGNDWNEVGSGAGALDANSYIQAMTRDAAGNIYAAGDFTDAAHEQYVAKWDGSSWTPVGAGPSALHGNGSISTLIIDAAGRLTAAGWLSDTLGGYSIFRWSGSGWSEVPLTTNIWPVNHYITSLASDPAGNLYAGGDFTDNNGDRYIAKLSGSVWTEPGLGGSKLPYLVNGMRALAVDTGGQAYLVEGNVASVVPNMDKWDGRTWRPLPTSTPTGYVDLQGLAADSSGHVYGYGSIDANLSVAKWADTGWAILPGIGTQLTINSLNHIATDKKGNVYVSGDFTFNGLSYTIARWDGTAWHCFPYVVDVSNFIVDVTGTVYAANAHYGNYSYDIIKISANDVITTLGVQVQINAHRWIETIALDAAGNLYVGGGAAFNAGPIFVDKWTGNAWVRQGTGAGALDADGVIGGMVFDNDGNLYLSGSLRKNNFTYLPKWDGQTWTAISDGQAFWGQNDIDFLCRDGRGIIYAGGQFQGSKNIGFYVFAYDPHGTSTTPCSTAALVALTADHTSVTGETGLVTLTARITDGRGTNTSFTFSTDRQFNTLIHGPAIDSVIGVPFRDLQIGANTIYVRLRTTNTCNTVLTAVDSVTIVRQVVNGITDIDYPNSTILAFPNPIGQSVAVSGLSTAKDYTLSLYNSQGRKLKEIQVSGQSEVTMNSLMLPPGAYWMELYDKTKKRRIGQIPLLKLQ